MAATDGAGAAPARGVGLALVLALLVNGFVWPGTARADAWVEAAYLAFYVHAIVSIHDGWFGRVRRVTWPSLLGAALAASIAGMAVNSFPEDTGAGDGGPGGTGVVAGAFVALLLADVTAMHLPRWRGRGIRAGLLLGGTAVLVVALALLAGAAGALRVSPEEEDLLTLARLMPPWHDLPYLALLLAVPDKAAGAALVLAAVVVPMAWPWRGVGALHRGWTGRAWSALGALVAGAWIGLGALGVLRTLEPEPTVTLASAALAAAYFGILLLGPPLLRRVARRPG